MTSLAFLLAAVQTTDLPPFAITASAEFKQALAQVEKSLAAGRFSEAEGLLSALPDRKITIKWDPKSVPPAHMAALVQGRDEAVQAWKASPLGLEIDYASAKPDIQISFTSQLPILEGTEIRQGAVHFVSFDPKDTKVESVIALLRGQPAEEAQKWDAASEVSYAIGASLGLSRAPREGGAMGRTDTRYRIPPKVMPDEILAAGQNLRRLDALRKLAAEKTPLPAKGGPSAFVGSRRLAIGEALQGRPLRTSFQITNKGEEPLSLNLIPDCSCFILKYPRSIAPGETGVVWVDYRTKEFPGPISKSIVVYTNDPEMEPLMIPVSGNVRPRYRFLADALGPVLLADQKASEVPVHLLYDEDFPWEVIGSEVTGLKALLAFEPFSGIVADPQYDDPARRREGYLMKIKLPGGLKPGRYPMSLKITTTDPDFPVIEAFFNVQSGIVSLPAQAWFGAISNGPAKAWVELVRPGRPFAITSLKSNLNVISAKVAGKVRDGYRIEVAYSGRGTVGELRGIITAVTDDPSQKTVEIGVAGTIR